MPGLVTHFVCTHVAVVPQAWVYPFFVARLDFLRPERRRGNPLRERLFQEFEALEDVMQTAAASAVRACVANGQFGLPPGKKLR